MDILLVNGKVSITGNQLHPTTDLASKVSQRIYVRLKSNKGYWFLDTTFGIAWLDEIFGKRRTKAAIDTRLQQEILKDTYIERITSWSSNIDGRSYSCQFTIQVIRSQDEDNTITMRLVGNESGLILQDSLGNVYEI